MAEIVRREDPVPTRKAPIAWMEYINHENMPGGLLTIQGEEWKRKRQAVRSLMLKPHAMENHVPKLQEVTDDLCTYLALKRDSNNYIENLPIHLYRFGMEGIVSVLFGKRAGCLTAEIDPLCNEFLDSVDIILQSCYNSLMVLAPLQRKYNLKTWRKYKEAWDTALRSTRYFTEMMMTELLISHDESTPLALSLLSSSKLSNSDIESMTLEFLFGGVDTTANSLGFILYLLAAHPEKQEKLRAEIETVSKNKGSIDVATIQGMTYMNGCIKEALRLYPTLILNGRQITKDFVSANGNIEFKSGDSAVFFHYCISRDEDLWENADKFIPERFDRNTAASDSPERQLVAIPFGFGTRGCIGKRIAELELSLCLMKVIGRFNLVLDDRFPLLPVTRALLTPGNQIPIKFNERRD